MRCDKTKSVLFGVCVYKIDHLVDRKRKFVVLLSFVCKIHNKCFKHIHSGSEKFTVVLEIYFNGIKEIIK